jgi:hypothetical protein
MAAPSSTTTPPFITFSSCSRQGAGPENFYCEKDWSDRCPASVFGKAARGKVRADFADGPGYLSCRAEY